MTAQPSKYYTWPSGTRAALQRLTSLHSLQKQTEKHRPRMENRLRSGHLGFHVYREENGELFRVTPELIAGSAFLTGTGTPLTAGRSYTWIDASPFTSPNSEHRTPNVSLGTLKYYLETGPQREEDHARSCHADPLGHSPVEIHQRRTVKRTRKRQNQKYDEFWRIQEIRERLLKDRPAERGSRTATPSPQPSPLEGRDRVGGSQFA